MRPENRRPRVHEALWRAAPHPGSSGSECLQAARLLAAGDIDVVVLPSLDESHDGTDGPAVGRQPRLLQQFQGRLRELSLRVQAAVAGELVGDALQGLL